MRKLFAFVAVAGLVAIAFSGATHAQGTAASDNAAAVVISGVNYCVPCALKEQGANAECGDTCAQFALKVTDIRDAEGNYIRGFVNKTVFYLANAKSTEITGNQELKDKTLSIEGTLFKDERVLDIKTFKEIEAPTSPPGGITNQVGTPR